MVKFIFLILFVLTIDARADIFDFTSGVSSESKLPAMIKKLKNLEMKDGPAFEDSFNQTIKMIENGVEEEKLYCSGDVSNSEGKTIPPAQKQLCMRDLKKNYIEATSTIFDLKKKYLTFIHHRQIEKLSEIQKKLKADIEKSF